MLNLEAVLKLSYRFRKYAVELQTNGIELSRHPEHLMDLYAAGVNTIAFSIDSLPQLDNYVSLFAIVKQTGINVRVCLNLTDMIPVKMSFVEIFNAIENAGRKRYKQETGNIRQLLVRNISIPKNASQSGREIQWIKDHTSFDRYLSLAQEFERIMIKDGKKPLMILPFDGSRVWGYRGISVVFSDYCIQESTREDAVRSLIYQADGHLYSSWSDPASILF